MTDEANTSNTGHPLSTTQEVVRLFSAQKPRGKRLRVALVGTYAPRSCGIATFATDVREKLATYFPDITVDVYALDAPGAAQAYAGDIHVIRAEHKADYRRAAGAINASAADVVWVQHEFGIFGGPHGEMIRDLVDAIAAPIVTTFHTVLSEPSFGQRAVMEHVVSRCARIMVMSQESGRLLTSTYRARAEIIAVIEHGAPDRPFGTAAAAKQRCGLAGKQVLTTFGLLGPGKGIEQVIAALPAILAHNPQVVYRILGATHPVLLAREGEAYRQSLMAQAQALGVAEAIMWENRFLEFDDLLEQLECCDIFITPYPNLAQSTSGTLSYAVALGKAVVSTPYVHARELLADGVGCLIETNAPEAISKAVNDLLASPERLLETQRRAYERGRRTIWPHFARASAQLVRDTVAPPAVAVRPGVMPGLSAVWAMSDSTGMFQHAIGIIPDRRHGYCLDDNARALMLMNVAQGLSEPERLRWSSTYASFIQFAWNPDEKRFRNFMRFDRSWCEDVGSEDSNGRALWALGHTIEHHPIADIRAWALGLFGEVAEALETMRSPRAMAFSALGAIALLRKGEQQRAARDIVTLCCETLARLVERERRPDWAWFETVLSYDNPRLSQTLIEGGLLLEQKEWVKLGLETLDWISRCQTSAQGHFRPIGSESFGTAGAWQPFDQQPLEAQAAIDAAHAAWIATGDQRWVAQARQTYQWFFGANDRGAVLADIASGRCRDGVTPRGRNENSGAESILAFQLGSYALSSLFRAARPQLFSGNDLGHQAAKPRPQPAAHP